MPNSPPPLESLIQDMIHEMRNRLNVIILEATDLSEQANLGQQVSTARMSQQIQSCGDYLRMIRNSLIPELPHPQVFILRDLLSEIEQQTPEIIRQAVTWPQGGVLNKKAIIDPAQVTVALVSILKDVAEMANQKMPFGLTLMSLDPKKFSLRLAYSPRSLPQDIGLWGQTARAVDGHPTLRRYQAARLLRQNGGGCVWTYLHPHVIVAADFGLEAVPI